MPNANRTLAYPWVGWGLRWVRMGLRWVGEGFSIPVGKTKPLHWDFKPTLGPNANGFALPFWWNIGFDGVCILLNLIHKHDLPCK